MTEIYCAFCGGVIHNPATIDYRPPRASAQVALTHPDPCTCDRPIVYEDLPLIEPPADDARPEG